MKVSEVTMRAYQWHGKDGGWQVGRPLLVDGLFVTRKTSYTFGVGYEMIMQPSPTGEATWVKLINMQPYPSETIEEPIVKGGE